jgi:hypothetical protein
VAAPAKGDNRFRDDEWQNNFVFDFIKQSYLIAARHIHDGVSKVEGLPEDSKKKVDFFTRHGFTEIQGAPVAHDVYEQLLESYDEGVAEFLDLERVKPNTLGNSRMLLVL